MDGIHSHDDAGAYYEGKERGKDYISPKYKTLPGTFQCKSGVEQQHKQTEDRQNASYGFFHTHLNTMVYTNIL